MICTVKSSCSPKFLCEGQALYDNLYSSRIIVGTSTDDRTVASHFAGMLIGSSLNPDVSVCITGSTKSYSTNEHIKSIASSKISFGTVSTKKAFLATISKHFACSHMISPIVRVVASRGTCVGKLLDLFVIGHTMAKFVRL